VEFLVVVVADVWKADIQGHNRVPTSASGKWIPGIPAFYGVEGNGRNRA